MLRPLIPIILVFIAASTLLAQQPTPTPKQGEDVVKISTNLIQIDVTVTDKSGKVVRDLKPEDFEIYENGKKQDISNFNFISNVKQPAAEKPADKKAPQVVLPPTPVRPEQVRRTIALVVDDLSMSFESIYYARRALIKFVDEQMQEGDLVAIVRTGGGMGALQQFTTDKRQLHAAIDRVRWNPIGTGKVGAFDPMEAKVDPGPTPDTGGRTIEEARKDLDNFRANVFATGTLGAINYVVRGMEELPGRKSIMLISDGFKIFETDQNGFRDYGRVLDALRSLVDTANRASVVIYTMDARGLAITGLTAADDTSGRTADEVEGELTDRRNELWDTQEGLIYLARQTGGLAIKNTNDLSGGIRKILDDQSYYLIGFAPDDETFDPKLRRFNKLSVKVKLPGLTARYRSGFYGVTNDSMKTVASTSGPTGRAKLFRALTSPFAVGQIQLRMNAIFNAALDGTQYVRSLLHIDLHEITFEDQPDKNKQAVIEVLVIAFGDNGQIVDQSGRTYTLSFTPEQYERYMKQGLVHSITFPVKKPGAFQLRVAIRDVGTDKVGSANQFVDVPNLKKDRLVMSGIVMENVPIAEWQRRNTSSDATAPTTAYNDTSTRQFKTGTVLNYAYTIFNAQPGSLEGGNVESQIRLFRDGKVIFEGRPQKQSTDKPRPKAADLAGSFLLGTVLTPGDYVLQITITDKLANPKRNSVSQFVQFEIVE